MFDRIDGCEYVFIWRTSEACPVRKSQGEQLEIKKTATTRILSKIANRELKIPIRDVISFLQVITVRSVTPGVVMCSTSLR